MFRKKRKGYKYKEADDEAALSTEIDPTSLTQADRDRLKEILKNYPDQVVFKKGVEYSQFTFTHTLVRDGDGSYFQNFDVVDEEYACPDYVMKYSRVGNLSIVSGFRHVISKFKKEYPDDLQGDLPGDLYLRLKDKIDLTNIPDDVQPFLSQVLLKAHTENKRVYFPAGQNRLELKNSDGESIIVHFNLSAAIVARRSEHHPQQVRFEVTGKRLGKGAFGEVSNSDATITPLADGSLFAKKPSMHAIKSESDKNKKTHDRIKHEYEMAKTMPYMHVKRPVFGVDSYNAQPRGFSVMRRFKGHELNSLIKKDGKKSKDTGLYINTIWTTEQRLLLSLELIQALQRLHDKEIIHRDIKPHNIFINNDKDAPLALYFDFGLSETKSTVKTKGRGRGSPMYMSPEAWFGGNPQEGIDVYALGILLRKLWRGLEETTNTLNKHKQLILTYPQRYSAGEYAEACKRIFDGLFRGLDDVSDVEKRILTALIKNMCQQKPSERYSLMIAANIVERMIHNRRLKRIKDEEKEAFGLAHQVGWQVRADITDYTKKEGGKWNMTLVLNQITVGLSMLDTHANVLKEYFFALRIRAFVGIDNVLEFVEKQEEILENYRRVHADHTCKRIKLECRIEDFGSHSLDPLYKEHLIDLVQNAERRSKIPTTNIDEVVELTTKLQRDADRVKLELDNLGRKNPNKHNFPLPNAQPLAALEKLFTRPENNNNEPEPKRAGAWSLRHRVKRF